MSCACVPLCFDPQMQLLWWMFANPKVHLLWNTTDSRKIISLFFQLPFFTGNFHVVNGRIDWRSALFVLCSVYHLSRKQEREPWKQKWSTRNQNCPSCWWIPSFDATKPNEECDWGGRMPQDVQISGQKLTFNNVVWYHHLHFHDSITFKKNHTHYSMLLCR